MKIRYTATARRQIAAQLSYLVDVGAPRAAARLRERIAAFVENVVAAHPRAACSIPERDIREAWIPRTPYVIQYRYNEPTQTITILALFHTSQDRSNPELK
jgi:plasmid stabilization system protein ParE